VKEETKQKMGKKMMNHFFAFVSLIDLTKKLCVKTIYEDHVSHQPTYLDSAAEKNVKSEAVGMLISFE